MPVTQSKSSSSLKREQMQKAILNVYNFMKKAVDERATLKTSQNTMYLISFMVESCTVTKTILQLPSSRWTESLGWPHTGLCSTKCVCGSITIWLVTLTHTPHCRIYKCMHPEKGNCKVCRNVHKSPNPLCSQTPKANQTHWKLQAKA